MPTDPANPWANDPFAALPSPWDTEPTGKVPRPPTGEPALPRIPKPKKPHIIPELDELYSVQNNLLKALEAINQFDHDEDDPDFHRFEYRLKNAYRVCNRWLKNYG